MRNLAISMLLLGACSGSANPLTTGDDQGVDANVHADGPGPGPGTPLPTTSFVVLTWVKDGPGRLMSYDVATSTKTQLAVIDDASINGIGLSPDRTKLAFTGLFRPEPAEVALGYPADSLWTLGVDGTFTRLTPPAPPHSIPGADYSIAMGSPTWSRDGAAVFITQGQWWWTDGMEVGGQQLAQVAATGGFAQTWTGAGSDCQVTGPGAFDRDGGKAVITRNLCIPASEAGVWLYANHTLTPLVQRQGEVGSLVLSPDGATALQLTLHGMDVIPVPAGMVVGTVSPPVAGTSFTSVTYDPTGRYLAACVNQPQVSDTVYLMDLGMPHPAWTAIPGLAEWGCGVSW